MRRVVYTALGVLTLAALLMAAPRALDLMGAWTDRWQQPVGPRHEASLALDADGADSTQVLVFYDPSRTDCVSCDLQTWRMALYSPDFTTAGAEVKGVAGGLRHGAPQLDEKLPLPWPVVYDLSGSLAEYYGVRYDGAPTVVVIDGDGRVRYRATPSRAADRVEADVLTTIFAVEQDIPTDADPAIARAR